MAGHRQQEFACKFAGYLGGKHGFCVSNGTVSLEIALRALGVGCGDEVIVPMLTWIADASAVLAVGAVPVMVDVDPATWCIDPSAVEAALTSRTRAVVAVHLYGSLADLDRLTQLASRNRIALIEDCAHTHGSRWRNWPAGSVGDIGSFSFQQSKPLTAGEGGFLITDRTDLAARIAPLMNCGRPWQGRAAEPLLGGNHRMTEFQAAVLLAQLERLDEQVATRADNARYLDERLGALPGIVPQRRPEGVTCQSYYRYAFRIDRQEFGGLHRNVFLEALVAEGIPAEEPYVPIVRHPAFSVEPRWNPQMTAGVRLNRAACPVAEQLSRDGIALPHPLLLGTHDDMDDIVAAVERIRENSDSLRTLRNRLRTLKADWTRQA
jgi:dTDP-4-amino-4,6-dideoxygalactose transaminase